jgi:NAD-dependent dihydropyrimidine dehydrogenase PreA subunit
MNKEKALVDRELCSGVGCRVCLYLCPRQCIKLLGVSHEFSHQYVAHVNPDLCTGCALCEKACFKGAIRVTRPLIKMRDEMLLDGQRVKG